MTTLAYHKPTPLHSWSVPRGVACKAHSPSSVSSLSQLLFSRMLSTTANPQSRKKKITPGRLSLKPLRAPPRPCFLPFPPSRLRLSLSGLGVKSWRAILASDRCISPCFWLSSCALPTLLLAQLYQPLTLINRITPKQADSYRIFIRASVILKFNITMAM